MSVYTITYYLKEETHADHHDHHDHHEHEDHKHENDNHGHHEHHHHDEHEHHDHHEHDHHEHDHNHGHHDHHSHEEHMHTHPRDEFQIIGEIKTLGAWAHMMPHSFLVKTDLSSEEILAKLKAVVQSEDMIFVTKVDANDVASLTPQVVEWIRA